ncbi:hypothetical protein SSX86_001519 [Deinandra increscens subsp. villosa]|uniref:Late embryogenesis abundant protein LEA-2 subgroup domain-containing protein n=1 Tax=Deinandra increscens subsp. villosa TaxID=3103831 RepID=A0AAP0HCM6_9ASTR
MTDKVYPASKPNGTPVSTKNPKLPLPPAKAHLYDQNGHPYRRNPNNYHTKRRRSNFRRCFCLYCFWSLLITILILLLATISGGVLYLLYRPHLPTFSVVSLKISRFNLTTATDGTTRLTSNLNLTISTKNPNNKIKFHYDRIAIGCVTGETEIANGDFGNSFPSDPKNITIIRSSLSSNSLLLETETVNRMRSDLKKKSGLRLKMLLDAQAVMNVESFGSKKVGMRIKCEGIHSLIPKSVRSEANSSSSPVVSATVSGAKCVVDLRIKIWKLRF